MLKTKELSFAQQEEMALVDFYVQKFASEVVYAIKNADNEITEIATRNLFLACSIWLDRHRKNQYLVGQVLDAAILEAVTRLPDINGIEQLPNFDEQGAWDRASISVNGVRSITGGNPPSNDIEFLRQLDTGELYHETPSNIQQSN